MPDGTRDTLELWIENTEGTKFWMRVFSDLKTRIHDILITVTDGLKGMPEALAAVFPATTLQTSCFVHLIRNSLDYAGWKDRKLLAAAIRPIYTVPSAEAALAKLDAFTQGPWGRSLRRSPPPGVTLGTV